MSNKILLHSCCGPCFLATAPKLTDFKIVSYFYNPNIFPEKEFEKRKKNLEKTIKLISHPERSEGSSERSERVFDNGKHDLRSRFFASAQNDRNLNLIFEKWNHEDWEKEILKRVQNDRIDNQRSFSISRERENRCQACWQIRLAKTAKKAKELKIKNFSTTLLSSPYQDFETIVEIGKNLAQKYNLNFIDRDFRQNYRKAQNLAKELGIYRQRYCGCLRSNANLKIQISK